LFGYVTTTFEHRETWRPHITLYRLRTRIVFHKVRFIYFSLFIVAFSGLFSPGRVKITH